MLRTASSLPLAGLLTLGSGPARFPAEPPACYRASWQLPGPDFHRQATTSLRTARSTMALRHGVTPVLLGARIIRANAGDLGIAGLFRQRRAVDSSVTIVFRWTQRANVTSTKQDAKMGVVEGFDGEADVAELNIIDDAHEIATTGLDLTSISACWGLSPSPKGRSRRWPR
jgi:hypothetical protein